jgi:hypothetical protein
LAGYERLIKVAPERVRSVLEGTSDELLSFGRIERDIDVNQKLYSRKWY